MRLSIRGSIVLLAGLAIGFVPASGPAAPPKFSDNVPDGGDKTKPYLDLRGKLAESDDADPKIVGSVQKIHEIELEAGKTYRIDMTSRTLDSFLRLEDPNGKIVAEDDDGGGEFNARIIYKAKRTGKHKIVATATKTGVRPEITGRYRLVVVDAQPRDIVEAGLRDLSAKNPPLAERRATVAEAVDFLAKEPKLTGADANIAYRIAYALDGLPKREGIEFADKLKTAFAAANSTQLRDFSAMFEGVARKLDLPGNEIALTGTLLDGKSLDWKSYRGKVVLIDFWATWCGPCRAEMPHLSALRKKFGEAGFDIVGVSADRDDDAPAEFMKKNGYDWACVFEKGDQRQPMVDRYGILAFPTTILVGRDGRVIAVDPGPDELDSIIARHVEKKSP
jgi:thiol-disulfide isomerase/thioredoxin